MPHNFTDADSYPFEPGRLFLGYSNSGKEVGVPSERHFLTVAGSGTGKGSALIIPNLLRWPHNALVIDPGGGNARATWEAREAMGQTVHVIDPARVAGMPDKAFPGVPDRLQRSFNPLALLDPTSRTYGEDLGVIADGLVMRHDPHHARWDNGGRDILAGIIDFALTTGDADHHTLPAVRKLLLAPPERLKEMFEAMSSPECNAPARAAAALALADMANDSELVGNATENTQWLDYLSMVETLSHSTCDLRDIKTKPCTIFLVIDPNYMQEHSRFLRLFVRSALGVMARGGETGEQCLFVLDEFFSLGAIDYVQKSSGLMRKNGVQLWPIVQNLDQLFQLYGDHGGETFFSNSDANIFFGIDQDQKSLERVCRQLGNLTAGEVTTTPPLRAALNISPADHAAAYAPPSQPYQIPPIGKKGSGAVLSGVLNLAQHGLYNARLSEQAEARRIVEAQQQDAARIDENDRRRYEHRMRQVGTPRLTPDEVRSLVGKGPEDLVARSMIVFGSGGNVLNVRLAPYFRPAPQPMDPYDLVPIDIRTKMDMFLESCGRVEEVSREKEISIKKLREFSFVGICVIFILSWAAEHIIPNVGAGFIFLIGSAFALWWIYDDRKGSIHQAFQAKVAFHRKLLEEITPDLTAYIQKHGPLPPKKSLLQQGL